MAQYGSGQLLSVSSTSPVLRVNASLSSASASNQRGGDAPVLSGGFRKTRGLKHQSLELIQLIDTTGGSAVGQRRQVGISHWGPEIRRI
jgi:hypothetical protein